MILQLAFLTTLVTIFCLTTAAQTDACSTKILVVWGEPEDCGAECEQYSSWDQCVDTCWEQDSCVRTLDARKCALDDDAPMCGDCIYSQGYLSDDTFYKMQLTPSEEDWHLSYTKSTCTSPSKLFVRCTVPVCIEIRWATKSPWYIDQNSASALCAAGNGMSLTGPHNEKEGFWLRDQASPDKAQENGIPESASQRSSLWFWIDGRSLNYPKMFVMEDITHRGTAAYKWYPGFPASKFLDMCLYTRFADSAVADQDCSVSKGYNAAACRTQIVTSDYEPAEGYCQRSPE
uniref:CW domain-containing protein n=1 Tax=Caenorhabditis japonica TaxID=281687 RepID=A0A8R1I5R1_CAEJA